MTALLERPTDAARLTPPRRFRPSVRTWLVVAALVGLEVFSLSWTDVSVTMLVQGYHGIVSFIGETLPPDTRGKTLEAGARGLVTVFTMALLGTTLALPGSLLLAVLASRTTTPSPVASAAAKTLLTLLRAIPDVIFALVFVTAVGLGPFAGVLALIFHGTGVQAKLWAEAMDEVDTGPAEALRTTGASSFHVLMHAVLPTAAPTMIGLVLYRFDTNVRTSLVLGLIGAGGIGFLIDQAIELFRFDTVTTYVLMVLALILSVEFLSGYVRRRLAA